MYLNNNVSMQINQVQQTVEQLIQQTQMASQEYQRMLQQEQQNAQQLEMLAQRERQAVQVIQTALQGHQTALHQLQQIGQVVSGLEQTVAQQLNAMNMQSQQQSAYTRGSMFQ